MSAPKADDLLAGLDALSGGEADNSNPQPASEASKPAPASPDANASRNRGERRTRDKDRRRGRNSGQRDSRPPRARESDAEEGDEDLEKLVAGGAAPAADPDDEPLREDDEEGNGHNHAHGSNAGAPREEVSLDDLARSVATSQAPAPGSDVPPPPLPTQPQQAAVVPEGKKLCPHCRKLTDAKANFCTECGKPQSIVAQAPAAPAPAASAPIPPTVWTAPPPSPVAPAVPVSQILWFLAGPDRKAIGPFDWNEMATKGLQADTQVHRANGSGWTNAGDDSLLKPLIKPAPQQVPQAPPPAPAVPTVPPASAPAPAAVNTPGFNPFAPPASDRTVVVVSQPSAQPQAPTPVVCVGCNTPRRLATDKNCRKCGQAYGAQQQPAAPQAAPAQPPAAPVQPQACGKCGTPRKHPTDKNCRKCGTAFPTS